MLRWGNGRSFCAGGERGRVATLFPGICVRRVGVFNHDACFDCAHLYLHVRWTKSTVETRQLNWWVTKEILTCGCCGILLPVGLFYFLNALLQFNVFWLALCIIHVPKTCIRGKNHLPCVLCSSTMIITHRREKTHAPLTWIISDYSVTTEQHEFICPCSLTLVHTVQTRKRRAGKAQIDIIPGFWRCVFKATRTVDSCAGTIRDGTEYWSSRGLYSAIEERSLPLPLIFNSGGSALGVARVRYCVAYLYRILPEIELYERNPKVPFSFLNGYQYLPLVWFS
jgi:hypothetical protein